MDVKDVVEDGSKLAGNSEVSKASSSHKKKKKSKKRKHESDAIAQNPPEETVVRNADMNFVKDRDSMHAAVSDEKAGDIPATSSEAPVECSSHKKKKKSKKHKHETYLPTEKMPEEPEGKKTDVNAIESGNAVNDEKISDMPATRSEVPEESSGHKKKKSKKNKHETDLLTGDMPEETEYKKMIGDIPATISVAPEGLSIHKKKKKSKKHKHETDMLAEETPEKAEGKKIDANVVEGCNRMHTAANDEKIADVPVSSSDVPEKSNCVKKNKKSKKRKEITGAFTKNKPEDTEGEKSDVNAMEEDSNGIQTTVNDEEIGDMPVIDTEVLGESCRGKKAKKRKQGIDEERERDDKQLDMCVGVELTNSNEFKEESSSHEKRKKAKKDKHKSELTENQAAQDSNVETKEDKTNSILSRSCPDPLGDLKEAPESNDHVTEGSSGHKKKKKSKKRKHECELEGRGKRFFNPINCCVCIPFYTGFYKKRNC